MFLCCLFWILKWGELIISLCSDSVVNNLLQNHMLEHSVRIVICCNVIIIINKFRKKINFGVLKNSNILHYLQFCDGVVWVMFTACGQ